LASHIIIALLIYIDNLSWLVVETQHITSYLDATVKLKDLENLLLFIGIEVSCTKVDIHLCQSNILDYNTFVFILL